jgi:hypothetical protein
LTRGKYKTGGGMGKPIAINKLIDAGMVFIFEISYFG